MNIMNIKMEDVSTLISTYNQFRIFFRQMSSFPYFESKVSEFGEGEDMEISCQKIHLWQESNDLVDNKTKYNNTLCSDDYAGAVQCSCYDGKMSFWMMKYI